MLSALSTQHGKIFGKFFLLLFLIGFVSLGVYAYGLDKTIVDKFEQRKWDIPARVYSKPLVLEKGGLIGENDLKQWLALLNYTKTDNGNVGTYTTEGGRYQIATRGFDYGGGDIEKPQLVEVSFNGNRIRSVESELETARLEPAWIGSIYPDSNEDREFISLDNTPQHLINALIATEDRNFYQHHGISLRGTTRAILNNFKGGSMQGGSTLTQQLIKNFYLNSERSLKRKANEAIMALLLERHYSKNDILQAYINEINLGQNGNQSVNGFAIASKFYFNKPLNELRLDQHALLVGIAKGSSYYNPRKHPERAKERRNIVLKNMLTTGKISQEDYDTAIQHELDVTETPKIGKPRFPDFLDYAKRELNNYYRPEDLKTQGLRIITTLDPIAQNAAEEAMDHGLSARKNIQGALVSADPHTGAIVALVGGGGEFTGFNRAIDAKRQVGSLLKPVIYLTALESGEHNLASGVEDSLDGIQGLRGWQPKNYGGTSHGNVPLITALANSYNQAAVRLGMQYGVKTFNQQLKRLGIQEDLPNNPSNLLGAIELSPIQMLGAYQVLASGGTHNPLYIIDSVIDEHGRILQKAQSQGQVRFSPESIYLTNYAMQHVITNGTATSAKSLGNNIAGKTGTTNNNKDAWFAGYSGNYVSVVWIGRNDNTSIGLTGGTGALPIWKNYMNRLKLTPVNMPMPKSIDWLWLENGTGYLSEETCENAVRLPVITKFAPTEKSECMLINEAIANGEYIETDEHGEPPVSEEELERMKEYGMYEETSLKEKHKNSTAEITTSEGTETY